MAEDPFRAQARLKMNHSLELILHTKHIKIQQTNKTKYKIPRKSSQTSSSPNGPTSTGSGFPGMFFFFLAFCIGVIEGVWHGLKIENLWTIGWFIFIVFQGAYCFLWLKMLHHRIIWSIIVFVFKMLLGVCLVVSLASNSVPSISGRIGALWGRLLLLKSPSRDSFSSDLQKIGFWTICLCDLWWRDLRPQPI